MIFFILTHIGNGGTRRERWLWYWWISAFDVFIIPMTGNYFVMRAQHKESLLAILSISAFLSRVVFYAPASTYLPMCSFAHEEQFAE